jgi:hypothetical protein
MLDKFVAIHYISNFESPFLVAWPNPPTAFSGALHLSFLVILGFLFRRTYMAGTHAQQYFDIAIIFLQTDGGQSRTHNFSWCLLETVYSLFYTDIKALQ